LKDGAYDKKFGFPEVLSARRIDPDYEAKLYYPKRII
jgi:hypothetical protein